MEPGEGGFGSIAAAHSASSPEERNHMAKDAERPERGATRSCVRCQPPGRAADGILARHAKGKDDALILVARCRESRT